LDFQYLINQFDAMQLANVLFMHFDMTCMMYNVLGVQEVLLILLYNSLDKINKHNM